MTFTNQEGRTVTVAWGRLDFLPTRKGEEVYINNDDLLTMLRRYDGKEVHITIQEMGLISNYQSSEQKAIKMNNTVVRKVKTLKGMVKDMAEEQGLDPDDLVVLTVSIEKVVGDPISFLLSKVHSSEKKPKEGGTITEGIWGEQPDPNDFFITVENWDWNKRFDVSAYLNKRDAWLEKVREELREAKAQTRVHRQHRMLYQEQRNRLREKLETTKNHMNEYPDVYKGACENCPYNDTAPEGVCPTCAVGKVNIWLKEHKKILEAK